jgi:hypothetical protein
MTFVRTSLRKVSIFLILGLCTVLASCIVDKYTETGEQLLANPDYANGLQGWQVGGAKSAIVKVDSGVIKIKLHEPRSSVQLSQQLQPGLLGSKVVLRGTVKAVGIVGGPKGWQKGRVVMVQYVEGKAIYSSPHLLVALDGTHDWTEYSVVIPVLSNISAVSVNLQLSHSTGELEVKGLSVYRVQANPVYGVVRWMVFGMWALFMICVFVPGIVGSFEGTRCSALVVLVIVAIIIGTTAPASIKNEAKFEIVSHAKTYTNQLIDYGGTGVAGLSTELKMPKWLNVDITKVAHFLLFGMLGGMLYFRQGGKPVLHTFVDIGILACSSELMQLFIDGRSALVGDVLLDLAGAGGAIVVLVLLDMLSRRLKKDRLELGIE